MMNIVLNKTLLTVAAGMLVLPFAAVALLAGGQALAVAARADGNWLLVALAISGVLVSSWHGLMKHPVL